MTHSYVRHDSFIRETWLIHMWNMTHVYVCNWVSPCILLMCLHVWYTRETWLIHMWDMTHSYVRHASFIGVTWLIHMWNMTYSYVWHDSFICETWLIHIWDMIHSYVRHDSFICETCRIHMWDMTHSYVRHGSFTCETWLIYMCAIGYLRVSSEWAYTCIQSLQGLVISELKLQKCNSFTKWLMRVWYGSSITYEWVMSHIWMSHVSHMNHMWDMTHSYMRVWYSSSMRDASLSRQNWSKQNLMRIDWLIFIARHDSFICETWLIHMWDMTHSSKHLMRIDWLIFIAGLTSS